MRAYHLSSADHALNNILHKRIKIARLGELNDPFELMAGEMSNPALRKAVRKWKDQWDNESGLLCFSRQWSNPLLWSHYAAKHTGIALGFEISDKFVVPIDYIASRIETPLDENLSSLVVNKEYVRKSVSTKYSHWAYEDEIRMYVALDESTEEQGLYYYPFDEYIQLREIIIGPMCKLDIENIRSKVDMNYKDIKVFKARLAFKTFTIVPDQRSL